MLVGPWCTTRATQPLATAAHYLQGSRSSQRKQVRHVDATSVAVRALATAVRCCVLHRPGVWGRAWNTIQAPTPPVDTHSKVHAWRMEPSRACGDGSSDAVPADAGARLMAISKGHAGVSGIPASRLPSVRQTRRRRLLYPLTLPAGPSNQARNCHKARDQAVACFPCLRKWVGGKQKLQGKQSVHLEGTFS